MSVLTRDMAHVAISGRPSQQEPSHAAGKQCDWMHAHQELSRLAKARALLEWEEGRGLRSALRTGVHRHLGFASFFEYVESLFGYKPRSIAEKLRVAEALEALPLLDEELRIGGLSWSAVRELSRVATAETERAWRDVARGKSVRQIEDWVSGRKPGDEPGDPADPALRRHVLSFEVRAETLATFREALSKLRRDAGGPLDEETALLLMARQVLGGPTDEGRASYQIAFTLCDQCGRGFQQGCGEQIEVGPEIAQMAACDAQYMGRVDSTRAGHSHTGYNAAAVSNAVLARSNEARGNTSAPQRPNETLAPASAGAGDNEPGAYCAHVGDSEAHSDPARVNDGKAHGHVGAQMPHGRAHADDGKAHGRAHVDEHIPRPRRPHAGGEPSLREDIDAEAPRRANRPTGSRARATQSISPATRRLVMMRDGKRCVVPGCCHATFVDLHHVDLRSEGGSHDPSSLVVLCAAHHRALHRGQLILEGSPAMGLVFRHADGSLYRGAVSPSLVAAQTQAFAALRRLGFREGDVRRALERLRAEVRLDRENAEQVVRAALRVLTAAHATSVMAP